MPKVKLYNVAGQETGEIELNDSVFGVDYNEAVIHQAVVRQMANERLGTHATKTRGLVRGGARSPGNRKAQAVPESDPSAPHCGLAAAPYSDRPPEAMQRLCRRRLASWLLNLLFPKSSALTNW